VLNFRNKLCTFAGVISPRRTFFHLPYFSAKRRCKVADIPVPNYRYNKKCVTFSGSLVSEDKFSSSSLCCAVWEKRVVQDSWSPVCLLRHWERSVIFPATSVQDERMGYVLGEKLRETQDSDWVTRELGHVWNQLLCPWQGKGVIICK
jgi:hypothetical protein